MTGIFSNVMKEKYSKNNSLVIKNESETFFFNLKKNDKLNIENLNKLFKNKELTNELLFTSTA